MSDQYGKLFEVIARDAIMGIMAFDSVTHECVYINRVACEALELDPVGGATAATPLNTQVEFSLKDLFADATSNLALPFSEEMLLTEGLFQNVMIRKKTGIPIIVNAAMKHVVQDNGAKHLLVMFQDITFQRKLRRELELKQEEIHKAYSQVLEQNKQLKDLDSAKDRFIALTTHELRTPLAAIVATAEVLELKFYETDEQRDEFIKTIHEQSHHLMDLVNDILDFAKIRAGKMEFFVEEVEIEPHVRKLVASFDTMAQKTNVTLKMSDAPLANGKAYCDVMRLREVVSNVVNNAIKYNKKGGEVVVDCQLSNEGPFFRITVTDTGPGIAAGKLHHVFNEFETVGHVSRHHKGTGLGMPISKRLMQAMGGDLTHTSVEGQRTSFYIDIPIEKVLAAEMYRQRKDSWGDFAA